MSEWLPIKSAPRDDWILVYSAQHGLPAMVARFDSEEGFFREAVEGHLMIGRNVGWSPPTHWAPLPRGPMQAPSDG